MIDTIKLKLSRTDLDINFKIEPQEIDTEALLTIKLLHSVEQKINQELHDVECFKLTAIVELKQTLAIDRLHIDKCIYATIKRVLDFSGNDLLKKPVELGKQKY